jgi:hypothetical protein
LRPTVDEALNHPFFTGKKMSKLPLPINLNLIPPLNLNSNCGPIYHLDRRELNDETDDFGCAKKVYDFVFA